MLNPYPPIASLQDKTPQHLFDTAMVTLGLVICLWMIANTKEAFGSHMKPKGLPKCAHERTISVIYHLQRHTIVLNNQIKKMAGHLP